MPILALSMDKNQLKKYHLEQALVAFNRQKTYENLKKIALLNNVLNDIVKNEIKYHVYNEYLELSDEVYSALFM